MKLPFTWSLSSVWQTATNTIRTTLNLAEKPKKVFVVFAQTSKTGVQSKYFCDVFRQKTHELSIVIANSMKLPFTWSLSSWWQNNTNTIRTILNTTEKPKKFNVFLLKRQKLGSNQNNIATFSDKNSRTFNRHCKEYEIAFHMIIVKLMAKQHKHHPNDIELDRKNKEK